MDVCAIYLNPSKEETEYEKCLSFAFCLYFDRLKVPEADFFPECENYMEKIQGIAQAHNIVKRDGLTCFFNINTCNAFVCSIKTNGGRMPNDIKQFMFRKYGDEETGLNALKEYLSIRLEQYYENKSNINVIGIELNETNTENENHSVVTKTINRNFFNEFFDKNF